VSILGNRVLRKEDPKLLTGGATYVDNLPLPGAAYVTYVRSTMAHARIASIDVNDARSMPGVIAVFTAADVDLAPMPPSLPLVNQAMARPFLADGVVRCVGEAVAVLVTEERYQGEDAAEMVFVDYEPLPMVVDPEAAEQSEVILFPDVGSNVALRLDFGHSDDLFAECEVVVQQRIVNQRVAPCPLEVRAVAAQWGDDGRLTFWSSSQNAHSVKGILVARLGIDEAAVRVIVPDVGGGFGAKAGAAADEVLVAWLARRTGRPLRWVETRSESMLALGHGRAQVQQIELGGKRDGTIDAYRLTILQDAGAYPEVGAALPFMSRMMTTGVYAIPKAEFNAVSVVTNTASTVAYRGAGRPEAAAAIERGIDIWASELGIDPVEARRRNLITKDAFPYTTPVGTTYDVGDYERAMDLVLEAAGYSALRDEQSQRRARRDVRQLGIGLAVYVEVTAGPFPDKEWGALEVRPDGTALVRTGLSPHGQGHHTSLAMIASDALGIPIDDIEVVHGDTDAVPQGGGTSGSRSIQIGGTAVLQASEQVVDQARHLAAQLLEANPDDVVLDKVGGRFHVAGTPTIGRTWGEVAAEARSGGSSSGQSSGLHAELIFEATTPTFPFGAHLAVVEVDMETGRVELQRLVAVDDAGRILNPLLAEGQIHGGLAQGVAQALLEEVRYDDDGNPLTTNLADYAFVSATELPSFETMSMETPTPVNPLGAKGIGESGSIGSTPAVQNAVVDALSHLGVRHLDMPAAPERVWRAIQEARA
jgi:aerobic carbon-monoxide dehydrogenase large subunit